MADAGSKGAADGAVVVEEKEKLVRRLSESKLQAKRVGFAIVGLGRAGHFHLTSLAACTDLAKLIWVVDIDAGRAKQIAEEKECKGSADFDDVIKDPRVDAVVIASTTNTHYEYCKKALLAGKAVFTEKPISHKPEQLKDVIDLAVANKKPFIVGYQRRIDRNFRALHREIADGKIGQLRIIKCCSRDNPLPPLPYLKVSGGIFYDMLTHDFDMMHYLSGEMPSEVYTAGHCYNADIKVMDDIDTVMCMLKFPSGLIATVDCSRVATYGYDQRVEAFGEKGMATAHNEVESTVVVATEGGFVHPRSHWSFPERYKSTYTAELIEFVAMVRANAVEPEEVVRRHIELEKVTAAAELSYRLGRAVKLDEVDGLRHHMPH